MSDIDVNKIQQNVKELQDQNFIDFQQWKKLGKDIEKLSEKIKLSDTNLIILMKKIKNDYENLKKIIVDENVQVQLNNKIEQNKNEIVDSKNKIENNINEINKKVNNETFQNTVDEINSQMDSIVNLLDNPNIENIGNNEYKLTANITLSVPLVISSNTILRGCGKTITSNFEGTVLKVKGENITIDGLKINCNSNACVGILVDTNCKKINIINNEVYNSHGGNSKATYGIFVSAIGCNDIVVKNNHVHDIVSLDDGVIAQRDGGWAKGILVDLYDIINERPTTDTIISTNITIENNTIENIQDSSDADGIYLEGYKSSKINNYKVINNFLKNCGKRFIKVLNSGNAEISGNYGVNEYNNMHAFISLYSGNCSVKNNTMLVTNEKYSRYGIEIGYQAKYEDIAVKDIVIENNKFSIGNTIDYGNVIARPNYDGKLSNVLIRNNILSGGAETIKFQDGASIELLEIKGNLLKDNIDNKSSIAISNVAIDKILIENNISKGDFGNGYVIKNLVQGYLNIKNNNIDITKHSSIVIDNFDLVLLENNVLNTTTTPYTITNVNNNNIVNNYDIRTKTTSDITLSPFLYKTITTDTFDIDVTNNTQVSTIKLSPSISTTLGTIVGNVGSIINIIHSNIQNVTLVHSASLHLKDNINVTLNNTEQCITIVKLDNRWVEINRNF